MVTVLCEKEVTVIECAIGGLQKSGKFIRTGHTFGGCWLLLILMMFQYKSMVSSSYNHCQIKDITLLAPKASEASWGLSIFSRGAKWLLLCV